MQVETQTIINYCIISLNELYHRHPEVPDPKPYDESESSSQHSDEFSSNEEDNDAFDSVVDKQSAAPLEEGKGEPEDGSATAAASKAGKQKTGSDLRRSDLKPHKSRSARQHRPNWITSRNCPIASERKLNSFPQGREQYARALGLHRPPMNVLLYTGSFTEMMIPTRLSHVNTSRV